VWQHEYDHLEGTLIIDRMRPLDRLANRRAIRDLERAVDGGRGR
jgi:peptide deformylase